MTVLDGAAAEAPVRLGWQESASRDLLVTFSWIPFSLLALLWLHDPGRLAALAIAVLVLSASHQPITLVLVHGDRARFATHPRFFTVAPFVIAAVAIVAPLISLTAVAVVGGLWNLEHTMLQRYGLARRYGKLSGRADGSAERAAFLAVLAMVVLWSAASPITPDEVGALRLGRINTQMRQTLLDVEPYARWLLVPVGLVTLVLVVRWLRQERVDRRRLGTSLPRDVYLLSTGLLLGLVLVHPVVGLLGYIGAHAVEYYAVVDQTVGKAARGGGEGLADRAVRRWGRLLVVAGWAVVFLAVHYVYTRSLGVTVAVAFSVFFGAGHFLYDSLIWRSPPAKISGVA